MYGKECKVTVWHMGTIWPMQEKSLAMLPSQKTELSLELWSSGSQVNKISEKWSREIKDAPEEWAHDLAWKCTRAHSV